MSDATRYLRNIRNLNMNAIQTHTIPGTTRTINGKSFFIPDEIETLNIIKLIFYDTPDSPVSNHITMAEDSRDKSILILNGSYTNGLASRTMEMLVQEGYTVSGIGDYKGEKQADTRILIKTSGQGADLAAFFNGCQTMVSSDFDEDIVIILGTKES